MSKILLGIVALLCISLLSTINNPLKENNMVQLAIQTVRIQADLPEEAEIRLVEKRESPLPDFYMVKLLVLGKEKEIPIVVYVDRSAEKVFLGNLFIRGENITLKEMGTPDSRRPDQGLLKPVKSLFTIDSFGSSLLQRKRKETIGK